MVVNKTVSKEISFKQNLIRFASGGENVIMGQHNSLMTLIIDIPSPYVIKCICHFFHLCAYNECQKLPLYIEDLTRDIYNYFESSPKRIIKFEEFQEKSK